MTTPTTTKQAIEQADACDHLDMVATGDVIRSLAQQVEELTAERDALKVDADRYQWLASYLVGQCTDADDQIISCKTVGQVSSVVDAMRARSQPGNYATCAGKPTNNPPSPGAWEFYQPCHHCMRRLATGSEPRPAPPEFVDGECPSRIGVAS